MSFTFDPNPIFFTIPVINHPITWYGCIFALAFFVGLKLFVWMYTRTLLNKVTIDKKFEKEDIDQDFSYSKKSLNLLYFYAKFAKDKTSINNLSKYLYLQEKHPQEVIPIQTRAEKYADSALLYIIIATIVGARLAHILFYENFIEYLRSPLSIIKTWEGGLASHGGIIAIIIASYLFCRKSKQLSYVQFLDLLSIPTMFVCACIRLGNLMNQEILGKATSMSWGITFLHPADFGEIVPRHPMQIYEFILYFCVFTLCFLLWKKNPYSFKPGKFVGLTLCLSFSARFFLEFLKVNQSVYDGAFSLQIGQLLNLPLALLGFFLIFAKVSLYKKQAYL